MASNSVDVKKVRALNERKVDLALKVQETLLEIARIDAEILKAGGVVPVGGTIGGTIGGTVAGTIGGTVGAAVAGTIGGTIGGTTVDIAGTIGGTVA
jgi:hypothetical protein